VRASNLAVGHGHGTSVDHGEATDSGARRTRPHGQVEAAGPCSAAGRLDSVVRLGGCPAHTNNGTTPATRMVSERNSGQWSRSC
jgi:hypothetical protein